MLRFSAPASVNSVHRSSALPDTTSARRANFELSTAAKVRSARSWAVRESSAVGDSAA